MERYLREITRLRQKYSDEIGIFTGAEITSDYLNFNHTQQQEDRLQDNLEYFSLFLIETYIIREPIINSSQYEKILNTTRI